MKHNIKQAIKLVQACILKHTSKSMTKRFAPTPQLVLSREELTLHQKWEILREAFLKKQTQDPSSFLAWLPVEVFFEIISAMPFDFVVNLEVFFANVDIWLTQEKTWVNLIRQEFPHLVNPILDQFEEKYNVFVAVPAKIDMFNVLPKLNRAAMYRNLYLWLHRLRVWLLNRVLPVIDVISFPSFDVSLGMRNKERKKRQEQWKEFVRRQRAGEAPPPPEEQPWEEEDTAPIEARDWIASTYQSISWQDSSTVQISYEATGDEERNLVVLSPPEEGLLPTLTMPPISCDYFFPVLKLGHNYLPDQKRFLVEDLPWKHYIPALGKPQGKTFLPLDDELVSEQKVMIYSSPIISKETFVASRELTSFGNFPLSSRIQSISLNLEEKKLRKLQFQILIDILQKPGGIRWLSGRSQIPYTGVNIGSFFKSTGEWFIPMWASLNLRLRPKDVTKLTEQQTPVGARWKFSLALNFHNLTDSLINGFAAKHKFDTMRIGEALTEYYKQIFLDLDYTLIRKAGHLEGDESIISLLLFGADPFKWTSKTVQKWPHYLSPVTLYQAIRAEKIHLDKQLNPPLDTDDIYGFDENWKALFRIVQRPPPPPMGLKLTKPVPMAATVTSEFNQYGKYKESMCSTCFVCGRTAHFVCGDCKIRLYCGPGCQNLDCFHFCRSVTCMNQ